MKLTYRKTYERCARAACYTTRERRIFRRFIRRWAREAERRLPWDQRAATFESQKDWLLRSFGLTV